MAQHSHYWSCTKFADWIRGTQKLKMGTGQEWDEWNETVEKKHPIRYWIAENALDAIQDFITFPVRKIYDAKYYINNRWVTRTNSLTAHARDIRPGSWCDVGNRFLPCLFNELVDFVEVELAWWHIAWADKDAREKYKTPFWAHGWFRYIYEDGYCISTDATVFFVIKCYGFFWARTARRISGSLRATLRT